ncbi:MAG: hypothetical protein R3D98_16115 [Candidatus Krumholzibacteriia bacterium]
MPIRFRYHPDRDLLIHVGEGAVTIEEIEALRRERREAGVPASVAHTLTDMRRAHFAFDPAALKANEQGRSSDHYGGTRHAELVDDPHPTAILLLWKTWLPAGVVVEVFSTVPAAYAWLGVEPRDGDLEF